jgi:hydrogenase maturation protease
MVPTLTSGTEPMAEVPAGPTSGPGTGTLVVGVGNVLRGDDGVAFRAILRIAADPRCAGVTAVARHQLTPELAEEVAAATRFILVDAEVAIGAGEVRVRRLSPSGGGDPLSHHVAPDGLLALAQLLYGHAPPAWTVSVGLVSTELGDPLSAPVEAALPAVTDAVARLLEDAPDA